jgi:hypothetical protein
MAAVGGHNERSRRQLDQTVSPKRGSCLWSRCKRPHLALDMEQKIWGIGGEIRASVAGLVTPPYATAVPSDRSGRINLDWTLVGG